MNETLYEVVCDPLLTSNDTVDVEFEVGVPETTPVCASMVRPLGKGTEDPLRTKVGVDKKLFKVGAALGTIGVPVVPVIVADIGETEALGGCPVQAVAANPPVVHFKARMPTANDGPCMKD